MIQLVQNSKYLWKQEKWYVLLVATALMVFVVSLFYGFPDSPSPWGDEGINVGIVKTWLETGVYSYQLGPEEFVSERPWLITNNYPVLLPIAFLFAVFGVGLWQVKVAMMGFVVAFLYAVLVFVSRYHSKKEAIVSLALLVSFLPLYGNGLSGGLGELPGLFFLLTGLLFLGRPGTRNALFGGVFVGLCIATKPLFLPIIACIGVGELYEAVRSKRILWRRWGALAVGVAGPLIVWFFTLFPPNLLSMEYLRETFLYYSNSQATTGRVLPNIRQALTDSTPLHFLFLSFLYWIGRFFSRELRPLSRHEIVLWLFVLVDVVYFLKSPGWYRYFFPAQLIALLYAGPAFRMIGESIARHFRFTASVCTLFPAFFLFLVQFVHLSSHRTDILYYNPNPRLFAQQVNAMHIPLDQRLFVIDQTAIAFMLKHPKVYQNFFVNAHLRVGRDLLGADVTDLPEYVIVGRISENEYLWQFEDRINAQYDLIFVQERFHLYRSKMLSERVGTEE